MIRIRFDVNMQDRFLDRSIGQSLDFVTRHTFAIAGLAVMKTARRSFQRWAQKPLAEMTEAEVVRYREELSRYKQGLRSTKPRRPDKISKPGETPRMHGPKSALRYRLFFALNERADYVVIGPEYFRGGVTSSYANNTLEQLEESRPFMLPSLQKVTPKIPQYIEQSLSKARRR
jgi:hypothetical protein